MSISTTLQKTNSNLSASSAEGTVESQRPFVLHSRVVTSTGGGPDKTILNSPRFLDSLGFDSACVYLRPPNDTGFDVLRARAEEWSAPLLEVVDRGKIDFRAVREIVRICREHNVAIWHGHDYKTNLFGLIANRYHPMKLITTAHGWVNFSGSTPFYYWLEKRHLLPRYEKILCVSETVLEQCLDAGISESKCLLVENAIDHHQFSRRQSVQQAKKAMFGISPDQLCIGAIGRLAEEKGFDLLIKAFERLIDEGVDARLVIAGEGPDQSSLENQIAQSPAAERMQMYGFCNDPRAFYEALDVFVLSSRREGLPNVILEAMSLGAPVLATEIDGVPRVVHDRVNGSLIPAEDVDSMVTSLLELCRDPDLRVRYSEAAVESIASKWSFDSRMSTIADLYRQLLSGS